MIFSIFFKRYWFLVLGLMFLGFLVYIQLDGTMARKGSCSAHMYNTSGSL